MLNALISCKENIPNNISRKMNNTHIYSVFVIFDAKCSNSNFDSECVFEINLTFIKNEGLRGDWY